MSIDIKAKNVKLWKNERQGRNGTWYTYSISVSKKMKDGSYKNKSMKVHPQNGVPNEVPSGTLCDLEGFMTLDVYDGRDGEMAVPMIFATDIKFKDNEFNQEFDGFEEVDESFPF